MYIRILLVALAALLALPLAQTASPVEAKKRSRTVTRTFSNTARIDLPIADPAPTSASLYPSEIAVRGLRRGRIRDVNVRLKRLTHTAPREVEVLLVGPEGQFAVLMAGVGGGDDVDGVTLRMDE
jgi:subtilisin-like proprotein convertase family protein